MARRGRSELTNTILTGGEVRDLVEKMLKSSGRRVDLSTPFVHAVLPDGSRLHVVIPDITRRHWAVNIRKFILTAHSLDELVALGSLTAQAARFLEACVVAGLNIIVAGGTQAGKTTLLNCLASAIPARERVVSAEEVFELVVPPLVRRGCAERPPTAALAAELIKYARFGDQLERDRDSRSCALDRLAGGCGATTSCPGKPGARCWR